MFTKMVESDGNKKCSVGFHAFNINHGSFGVRLRPWVRALVWTTLLRGRFGAEKRASALLKSICDLFSLETVLMQWIRGRLSHQEDLDDFEPSVDHAIKKNLERCVGFDTWQNGGSTREEEIWGGVVAVSPIECNGSHYFPPVEQATDCPVYHRNYWYAGHY